MTTKREPKTIILDFKHAATQCTDKPVKHISRKKIIAKLDALYREFIRRRAMKRIGGCERCGTPKRDYKELDTAHLHSRRNYTVRWDEHNAVGLCGGCHLYLDSHIDAKKEFARQLLGREDYDRLYVLANMTSKQSPIDYKLVEIYLKEELKVVKRNGGFVE